ncbi:MAG: hypothetical protein ACREDD_04075 [Methylocella sp.]
MRINIDLTEHEIEPTMHWLAGLIGGPLDRRVRGFEQHQRRNPLLASHLRETFSLEATLVKARRYKKTTGQFPIGSEYDVAYGFAVGAHRIHKALPGGAQSRFSGCLRNAVNGLHGVRPLAFEIGMAVHLMRQDWDVNFLDYSGSERFDFLIRRDGMEIEVELKSTSGDAGWKIHRQEMNRLADLIAEAAIKLADTQGCHLFRVTIPDRLPSIERELAKIAALVDQAVTNRCCLTDGCCSIKYDCPNVSDWPDPRNGKEAHEFVEGLFGVSNRHILFCGRERFSVVAVLVESSAPDQALEALADQVKQAADQCSGKRPAVIALQLCDPIDRAELEIMAKTPSGLHFIAGKVFEDSNRLHLDSIAFTVPQLPGQQDGRARQPSAPVATLFNDNPLYSCAEARSLFRPSSAS